MSLKIVVLAKQVPDTRNVGKDAMTPEGTVNRAALPAIFNPDDLNALEQALRLKEQNPGSTVGVLTMGPPRAGEIIRQGLYRGADTGWLLTDRLFAGADTLATSYALSTAIKKIGKVDIVLGGRQAIDGDTAQVGPQVAQKLGLNQVTYAERPYLTLNQWSVADVDGDPSQCGLAGSPTKVKTVQNIVFQAKESKTLTASDADIDGIVKELLQEKIIG